MVYDLVDLTVVQTEQSWVVLTVVLMADPMVYKMVYCSVGLKVVPTAVPMVYWTVCNLAVQKGCETVGQKVLRMAGLRA